MTVEKERGGYADRLGRRGLGAAAAALVLGVVMVGVGAAGFVVLSAISHTTSSSEHSCSPSSSPQCAAKPHGVTEARAPGEPLPLARG